MMQRTISENKMKIAQKKEEIQLEKEKEKE
jgi:hypothetical protein